MVAINNDTIYFELFDTIWGSRGLFEGTILAFIYRIYSQTWGVRWWAIPFRSVQGMPEFFYFPVMLE